MNTKEKGNIGESKVIHEFLKRGIQVSIPFGDTARYDLIADINGKLSKIQVKYCDSQIINGSILAPCRSSLNHTTNKHYTTYENDVDYFAFYIPKWDETLLMPIDKVGDKKSIYFRKDCTRNNQDENSRFVGDYTFDKILYKEARN